MMIEIDKSEIDGVYEIGQYYIWLTEEWQIGNFSFYLSEEEAQKDLEEHFEKINESYANYWASRCPQ